MNPDPVPNPPLPNLSPLDHAVESPARRNLVGRIGLVFSCVAALALLMMFLLQPG
jgi:hypothetical protein